jgi:hypothetical protein
MSVTTVTYTPFACGEMPEGVRRWDDGPPFGRLELSLDADPKNGDTVFDNFSCEMFQITTDVPCGLGCRCAAEARWVR